MTSTGQDQASPRHPVWPRALLALALGTGGGWLASLAGLPLPWMIGAMLATTLAAVAGLPVALWQRLREGFVVVLGVMLGSSFTPEIAAQLPGWGISILILGVYTVLSGALGAWFFHRVAGYDRITSYFSAMPGGLSVMIFVGEAMGGDSRLISLTHASRLLLVVLILPFAFQIFMGYDPGERPAAGPAVADLGWLDVAVLTASGVLGWAGARLLRVPAPAVVGPMLLSAAVHLGGVIEAGPPQVLVAAAQVVVGSALGCRFAGTAVSTIWRTILWAAGGTVVLLGTAVAAAWAGHLVTGLPVLELTLAYSPGGLAEMIVVFAPLAFRLLRARQGGAPP